MPWSDAFCYLWIIHLHVQRIESFLSILKQIKIQWGTQSPTGSSLTLTQSECVEGGGGGGEGGRRGIVGEGGVPPSSPNPDPIIKNDQKCHFPHPFSDQTIKSIPVFSSGI